VGAFISFLQFMAEVECPRSQTRPLPHDVPLREAGNVPSLFWFDLVFRKLSLAVDYTTDFFFLGMEESLPTPSSIPCFAEKEMERRLDGRGKNLVI
jgi:hypothetical protein